MPNEEVNLDKGILLIRNLHELSLDREFNLLNLLYKFDANKPYLK
jgi:hypothetical protein